jgi:hypothetical protein
MDFTKKLTDTILLFVFSYLIELPSILPPSAGDPGLTLLVVCHRWRDIILNSANKWTNMVVSPTVSSDRFSANIEFGRCWLNVDIRRHSGYWLNIFLLHVPKTPRSLQNGNTGNTSSDEITVLENIVFPAARRAKCLSLPFCSTHAAEAFLTAPAGRFYFLESVEICFPKCGQSEVAGTAKSGMKISKPITVFQNLPFLRCASIIMHNGLNPLTLLLPWYQLTMINMRFTTIHPKVFRTILSKSSPSLTTGFFTIKFSPKKRSPSSYTNQDRLPKIVAPALKHLHLRLIDPSLDCDIFTRIRLPALIRFWVDLYDSNAGWMMNIYQPLLRSSSNTLETLAFLDLRGFDYADDGSTVHLDGPRRNTPRIQQDLWSFFSNFPMVRVLRLPVGLYIPQAAMELISLGKLLPRLEILEVASSTGVDILTMVKDRNEVAHLFSGLVGSSSSAPSMCDTQCHCESPSHFSELVLWTSASQKRSVESCAASIQSLSSSQKTKFKIIYADQSLF